MRFLKLWAGSCSTARSRRSSVPTALRSLLLASVSPPGEIQLRPFHNAASHPMPLAVRSTANITSCTFRNLKAVQGAALWASTAGPVFISRSTFSLNQAESAGGALYFINTTPVGMCA